MKRQWFIAGVLILLLAGSCTTERDIPGEQPTGTAVSFKVSTTYENRASDTRTVYSGEVFSDGQRTVERIDWEDGDLVTIACAKSPEGQADYRITGESSGSSMMLKPLQSDGGLSWGTGEHCFLALYPAAATDGVGEENVSLEEDRFRMVIPSVQHVTEDGATFSADMRLAYMWAAARATRDGSTPVKLSFRPMMTAFEFTLSALDPYPVTLNSITLQSASTALSGEISARVLDDLQNLEYSFENTSNQIVAQLGGARITQEQSISFTLFCLPQDITQLSMTLDTDEGMRTVDFKKDGQWLTFGGGIKMRIRNLPVETRDLLFEGTANGAFSVCTVDAENKTVYTETLVTPDTDGHFSARLPRLTDQPSHYRINGEDNLLTITHFPETISTDSSLTSFLRDSRKLTGYVPFDSGGITRFSSMFRNCAALEEIRDLDTSKGETFAYMFSGCSSLREGPAMDTSKGTSVAGLFDGCSSLVSVPEYDTSSSESFNYMFNGCTALSSVPLFNTAKGTTFRYMFSQCKSLTSVPLFDTGMGNYFDRMFEGDSALETVPLFSTGKGTTFAYMFNGCGNLRSVPSLNLSSGRFFNSMFFSCRSLTEIPDFDTAKGEAFDNMFNRCSSLETVPALPTGTGKSFHGMFMECTALREIPLLETGAGTDFSYMFYDCLLLESVPTFNLAAGTDFKCMFYGCEALTGIPEFSTANGVDFSYMFSNCFALTSFPGMDTAKGTRFQNMFKGDSGMTRMGSIDCSGAGTDADMQDFVSLCTSLAETNGFGAVKVNLDLRDLPARRETVMTIVEGLATAYGKELTLSAAQEGKLTAEDRGEIATKGWSIVIAEESADSEGDYT